MGLTLVPTPLGNLRDVTLRALDALRDCDLLVAEDTRVARTLLHALDLPSKPLASYREQNAAVATAAILERAATGRVALVSDAGMPGISDPGRELVAAARAAGIAVEVLPGPSAFVCAAVLSGFVLEPLCFAGFLPRTAGARGRALRDALARPGATVFYESPHRIVAALESLAAIAPQARAFVVRELTKRFEQQLLGTAADLLAGLERPVRGELALVLAHTPIARDAPEPAELDAVVDAELACGTPVAAIAKELVRRGLAARGEAYAFASARKACAQLADAERDRGAEDGDLDCAPGKCVDDVGAGHDRADERHEHEEDGAAT